MGGVSYMDYRNDKDLFMTFSQEGGGGFLWEHGLLNRCLQYTTKVKMFHPPTYFLYNLHHCETYLPMLYPMCKVYDSTVSVHENMCFYDILGVSYLILLEQKCGRLLLYMPND